MDEERLIDAKIKLIERPLSTAKIFFEETSRSKDLNIQCEALQNIAMANKAPYKTTFEPENTIQPIYTGGSVALDQSGQILATTLGEDALLTDLNTGRQLAKIEGVSS